jgi:hypothetical protein
MRAILTVCVLISVTSQCDATGPSLLNDNGQPVANEQQPVIDQKPLADNNNPRMPSPFIQRHNVEISWPKIEIPITFTLQHEIQAGNWLIACFAFVAIAIVIHGFLSVAAANVRNSKYI